ncbi:MAG: ABC transporter ATP-binding protein, partial [Planctomycetota bacterium]
GPNGAGKSTLISLLLGQVPATRGSGSVLGFDIRRQRWSVRQRTGFVPETDCFIPGMSGVGYVVFAGRLAGMGHSAAMQRAHQMLDLVELENERYRPVETYSAGMKQRVKLAQALVHDPELVFLDEPTNGMDPRGRRLMLRLMNELPRRGVSILLSSHLLPDVEEVCQRVIVLGRGRVLAEGEIREMRKPSETRCRVRVVGEDGPFRDRLRQAGVEIAGGGEGGLDLELPAADRHDLVLRAAVRAGVHLREFRPQRSSLEQVFLEALQAQREADRAAMHPAGGGVDARIP